jgi:hypothetical protein
MIPFSEMGSAFGTTDRTIRLAGVFGAENAVAQAFEFHIGKQELLTQFCADPGIASQISPNRDLTVPRPDEPKRKA